MRNFFKIISIFICLTILFGCSSNSKTEYQSHNQYESQGASSSVDYSNKEEQGYVDIDSFDKESNSFNGKKIIYSGYSTLESKNYNEDLKTLNSLFKKHEILISSSQEEDYNDYWYSYNSKYYGSYGKTKTWTLRIPIENFNSFIEDLNSVGAHLRNMNINSSDVTKVYSDNELQIISLEVQKDRLLELLSQANNVTEILEIEDRLTNVRYQLESLNNTNNQIDYDIEMSEFSLTLKEVNRYSTDSYSFSERLIDSFGESIDNFLTWLSDFTIWMIMAAPFVLLFMLILFSINLIRVKRGKEKLKINNLLKFTKDINYANLLKYILLILISMILLYILLRTF